LLFFGRISQYNHKLVNLNENEIKELLEKYLNGTLSESESIKVEKWYESFDCQPGQENIFDTKKQELNEYQSILQNIHNTLNLKAAEKPSLSRWFSNSPVIKIAAIVIVVFVSVLSFYYLKQPVKTTNSADIDIIIVKAGEMKTVELADGTRIWLNAATKFSHPKQFSSDKREVNLLEGEAFFEVKHDDKIPFIVHSKGINTQVLGTSFNISAYQYAKAVKVSVATGKVAVNAGKKLIDYLTPDQEINYLLLNGKHLKKAATSSFAMSWIKGEVILDQVDFESLKAIIYDNYKYTLTGNSEVLKKLRFSATLKRSDNIISVMELISSINHTKYSLTSKIITMY
jgi:transmembrane sensor